jgi:hypothetical protein
VSNSLRRSRSFQPRHRLFCLAQNPAPRHKERRNRGDLRGGLDTSRLKTARAAHIVVVARQQCRQAFFELAVELRCPRKLRLQAT